MRNQKYAIITYAAVRLHLFFYTSTPHSLLYAEALARLFGILIYNTRFTFVCTEFRWVEMQLLDLSSNTFSINYF